MSGPTAAQLDIRRAAHPGSRESVQRRQQAFLALCRTHCLPPPELEIRFGQTRHRLDYGWPSFRVAVEENGGFWGRGRRRHGNDDDLIKINQAQILGWLVLQFSGRQIRDASCVRQIRAALAARGPISYSPLS